MRTRKLTNRARGVVALGAVAAAVLALGACSSSDSGGSKPKAPDAQAAKPLDPNTKVTISVNCEPPTTQPAQRKFWLQDVAAFHKLHPNITIVSKDQNPCDDPNTFNAKLASGRQENVFYLYFTDTAQAIESGQVADIQPYLASVPSLKTEDFQPSILQVLKKNGQGDLYGLPRTNYTLGLVYNRKLFQQAGLDPDQPPTTWDEVRADAKKITALGKGKIGYADYSAGNTGGWHFTAELYSQGGHIANADGTKADFNNDKGLAVLNNLKQMRWTDNTMGQKQLLQYNDLIQMMASGKLGMCIGAPDYFTTMRDNFSASFADYGMGPMPGGQGTLLGGDGYMFNKKDTPDQIKAGLLWLQYEKLTPGKGQFDYGRAKAAKQPVGLPEPDFWLGATAKADEAAKASYADIPTANFKPYIDATPTLKGNIEPPSSQAVYKVLDGVMSAILTDKNADPQKLLDKYSSQVTSVLLNSK
jgi:multiple sugar transport system substrate-binding protein